MRRKRLHKGHQRTLLSNYISGESLLRVQPWIRLCISLAGGEVWKWSCCFSGSNKKPSACFYHHQHGANKTDELERVSWGPDVLVLPRLVGNKGGGGKQMVLKGEDSRPANIEKKAERIILSLSLHLSLLLWCIQSGHSWL